MRQSPHDETTDRLMARGLAERRPAGDCPDPDLLAAFHEQALTTRERDHWMGHVADCQRCQQTLAAIAASEDAGTDATGETPGAVAAWWNWRWLAPLSGLAVLAIAVWVAQPPATTPGELDRAAATPDARASAELEAPASDPAPAAPAPAAAAPAATERLEEEAVRSQRPAVAEPPAAARNRAARADAPVETRTAELEAADTAGTPSTVRQMPSQGAPLAALTSAAGTPLQLSAPDSARRWRVTAGVVEGSLDDGQSWQTQSRLPGPILAGAAPGGAVAWLVGDAGLVVRTEDGETWRPTAAPADTRLIGIEALGADTATVSAADGRRFRTEDGGASWRAIP